MRTPAFFLVILFLFFTSGLRAENAPVTTAGIVTNATTVPGAVVVPITVKNFVSIGSFTLTLRYQASRVTYVSATPNSSFTGMTIVNTAGKLVITWPQTPGGITLPDETHLLDLTFTYISGNATLNWDLGTNVCKYYKYSGGSYTLLTDSPKASYYINGGISSRGAPVTFAPVINNAVPGPLAIPVTVNNFTAVAAITLTLEFNPVVLSFQNCVLNPSLSASNLSIGTQLEANGKMLLTISWFGSSSSLANGSTLITVNYLYSNSAGSYSSLDWIESGSSCEYADPTGYPYFDSPASDYYKNGLVYTQYAPRTWLPVKTNAMPGTVALPVYANSFNNVRSFNLSFEYDPAVMNYGSFTPDAAFGSALTATDAVSGSKRKIVLSWTGTSDKTLPDGSLLGTVNFAYASGTSASGTSALAWITGDATSCRFNDASGNAYCDVPKATYYQDGLVGSHLAPVTAAWQVSGTVGQPVTIPLKVYNYTNIGQFAYTIDYDPAVLTWQSGSLAPALGGTFSADISNKGRVLVNWSGTAGSLADGSTLVNLTFTYNGGATPLAWFDDGTSCKYAETSGGTALYDLPRTKYYINGYVGPNPLAAEFAANSTYVASGGTITLTDQTTGTPTAWNWNLSPSTYYFANGTSATSQNPQVKFTSDGVYAVTLIATRGTNSSIKIKKDYLFVGSRVFLTCPDNKTVASCQTQAAIDAAYATWLASATSVCNCNCVLTNNSTGPPSACGETKTVTWTLTSDCESPVTCTKTFTVTDAPAVVLNAPAAAVEAACQTQAAINTKYATWLTGVSSSGGCTLNVTNDTGAAPAACGGSVTVTWTATSNCEGNVVRSSTFTVTSAPVVAFTCATNLTVGSCLTQESVNTAFAGWLATTTFTGGCNAVMTNNSTGAPAACGGSTTITWTVTSTCEAPKTCSATFTVPNAPAVVFNCGVDVTVPACQTQAQVNAAYLSFIGSTTASGGCGGVLTNNAPMNAPAICGGFVNVTWTYTSSCDVVKSCTKRFSVTPAPAVAITCATDLTVGSCLTQESVNSAYAGWLATTTFTGGCNAVMTNNSTGAPSACGGSTTITWTVTSTCEAPKTCSATFTVPNAPAVVFNCGVDVTVPACQTQAQVDAAYLSFIGSTTASGGCGGVLTNNAPVNAPAVCGGFADVTWTYTSSCDAVKICTKRFSVTPAPAVAITCATDLTVGSCLTQESVNSTYTGWLATATFTGGCNAVITNNSTGAPSACGGSTTITWTVTSTCEAPKTCSATFTVPNAPAVVFNCGVDVTVPACQTQAQVDAAYLSFIGSTTASGGCGGVLTNNAPVNAPAVCGGFADVTWTYTSSCDVVKSCTKRFSVTPAPAVAITCATDLTVGSCLTQESVNSTYTGWLATATFTGGCNAVMTNNSTGAPAACGGSTTITWTATSSCEAPETCSATFTVPNAPAVVFNCGVDVTVPACQTQALVDAAYLSFIGSTTASGGCGGVLTNNAPVNAPAICGGFVDVTWTYTSSCDVVKSCTKRFSVTPAPAVAITCATDLTVGSCLTQESVNSAYTGWLATTTFTGGCNAVMTNNSTGAPAACGGYTTITWTVTSSCETPETCSATFTVPNAPAVVFNCGVDVTVPACQTQALVDAAYLSFIGSTTASGGCGGVLTNNAPPSSPPACGGSVNVTWTYTDACSTTSCTKTFAVTSAPAVVFNCATDKTEAACQSQGTIDASFATWLTTAGASGGCNGIFTRTPAFPVAPPACGGFTDVTWTYTSSCEETKTCTRRFSVTAAPPAVLTCPADHIMEPGQSQPVVDLAYANWLASVTATGGCNASLSNDGTGAPPESGGSVTVTWTYTSSCAPLSTSCSATFAVTPTYTLSGALKYYNLEETPLKNTPVRLKKSTIPRVDVTSLTLADGSFAFGNLCTGTYTLTPIITSAAEDINSTDAAQVNAWGTTTSTIEYVQFLAGDVSDDFWINGTDALRIQLNFVDHLPFSKDPWSFWPKGALINSNWDPITKPTEFSIVMNGSDVSDFDLYTLCTGDFSCSFTPLKKAVHSNIQLTYNNNEPAGAGMDIELPVRLMNVPAVGAVSLIMNFPPDLMEVTGVTMKENDGNLAWSVRDNELRIGWYSMQPLWFESNSDLLVIHLRTSETFGPGDAIRLKLAASSLNELADSRFKVIPDAVLGVNVLEFSPNGIVEPSARPVLALECSPNPFTGNTLITYHLPAEGQVTLEINDLLGQTVLTPVNKYESSGSHSVNLDGLSLQPGVYLAKVKLHDSGGNYCKTIKLIKNR